MIKDTFHVTIGLLSNRAEFTSLFTLKKRQNDLIGATRPALEKLSATIKAKTQKFANFNV